MHGCRPVAIPALTAEEAEVLFRHHQGKVVQCQVRESSSCFAAAGLAALLESCSVLPSLPEFHASSSLPSFKQILSENLIFERLIVPPLEKVILSSL